MKRAAAFAVAIAIVLAASPLCAIPKRCCRKIQISALHPCCRSQKTVTGVQVAAIVNEPALAGNVVRWQPLLDACATCAPTRFFTRLATARVEPPLRI